MYRVGDRVRVKQELMGEEAYGNIYFGNGMEKYRGKDFKIANVDKWVSGTVAYELEGASNWDWSDKMLIEVEKVEESEHV